MKIILEARSRSTKQRLTAGAVAGFLSSVAAAFIWMLASALQGQGFWFPMQLMAGLFVGVNAILGGFSTGLIGSILFLAGGSVAGAIFGLLLPVAITVNQLRVAAVSFGIAAWAVRDFILLPFLNPVLAERLPSFEGWWFIAHLVYGAGLSMTAKLIEQGSLRSRFDTIEPVPSELRAA